jgi:hypothetical protein
MLFLQQHYPVNPALIDRPPLLANEAEAAFLEFAEGHLNTLHAFTMSAALSVVIEYIERLRHAKRIQNMSNARQYVQNPITTWRFGINEHSQVSQMNFISTPARR